MRFRIVVTDIINGNTIIHEGDLATIYNHLDKYCSFELTVGEINRATVEGEILQLSPYTTAKITRIA